MIYSEITEAFDHGAISFFVGAGGGMLLFASTVCGLPSTCSVVSMQDVINGMGVVILCGGVFGLIGRYMYRKYWLPKPAPTANDSVHN